MPAGERYGAKKGRKEPPTSRCINTIPQNKQYFKLNLYKLTIFVNYANILCQRSYVNSSDTAEKFIYHFRLYWNILCLDNFSIHYI